MYDTKGAAAAGRMGLVRPGCNGITNIHSVPVDRAKPVGFITDTVSRAVTNMQDRLAVVDRARAEKKAGLPGDRSTAERRTARDEDTVRELEEHVKKGTLREVRDISEQHHARPSQTHHKHQLLHDLLHSSQHTRTQIEELMTDYPDWEDDSMYYSCPHCVGKGLPWEEEDLDFGGPSARLKRALHTSNNPRQASPDHIDTSIIDYRKVRDILHFSSLCMIDYT